MPQASIMLCKNQLQHNPPLKEKLTSAIVGVKKMFGPKICMVKYLKKLREGRASIPKTIKNYKNMKT